MPAQEQSDTLVVFQTTLGWMAMICAPPVLKRLTLGHRTADAAVAVLGPQWLDRAEQSGWNLPLVRQIQDYAAGSPVDFRGVEVDPGPMTEFQRRVLQHCRRIPFGKTRTYGQLAAKAGRPGAARAVGNCMAANPIPIVIPCHRVVAAGGRLGGFSAPGGIQLKQRLLKLENHEIMEQ